MSTEDDYDITEVTEHGQDNLGVHFRKTCTCGILNGSLTRGSLADSGQHPVQRMSRLAPRSFVDLLPADEDINLSDSSVDGTSHAAETHNPPQRRILRVLLMLHDSLQTTFNAIGLC
jgi:hypothetical protein